MLVKASVTIISSFNIFLEIVDAIEQECRQRDIRLFAVVYIDKRQFKVSENDLIVSYDNVPLDVGDKIKLEKVTFTNFLKFLKFDGKFSR